MSDLTLFGKYPVPVGPEAMDLPGQMMEFAESLDPHTVLYATSSGDRDSKYSDLGKGALVTTTQEPWTVWLRIDVDGNLAWATVYEDTGFQSFAPSAIATNWTDNGSNWRRKNGSVELNLRTTYTGDAITAPASGNIPDTLMLTLPSAARPVYSQIPGQFYASTVGNLVAAVAGGVSLTHMYPNSILAQGTGVYAFLGPYSR